MDELEPLEVSPEKKQWLLAQLAGVYEEAVHERDIPRPRRLSASKRLPCKSSTRYSPRPSVVTTKTSQPTAYLPESWHQQNILHGV